MHYKMGKLQTAKIKESDENNFFFAGGSVHRLDNEGGCELRYTSSMQGGETLVLKISEEDFYSASRSEIDLEYLLSKYS